MLLLLFSVSLGKIVDSENVIDDCGSGLSSRICGLLFYTSIFLVSNFINFTIIDRNE